jgi:hypothetical protein
MYAWMARWLQQAPADVTRPERSFTPAPLADALVFHQRALPSNAVTAEHLTENWIAASRRQLASTSPGVRARALAHALGVNAPDGAVATLPRAASTVLLASEDADLQRLLKQAGIAVRPVTFARHDAEAAGKVRHFETYNRTAAGQRVADIVAAARAHPGAILVADGDAALPGLLAAAVSPLSSVILDVGGFDPTDETHFVERLYIPGLRRAGDVQTASRLAKGEVVIHNASPRFTLEDAGDTRRLQPQKLSAREIVTLVRTSMRRSPRS